MRSLRTATKSSPHWLLEKARVQQRRPNAAKNKIKNKLKKKKDVTSGGRWVYYFYNFL